MKVFKKFIVAGLLVIAALTNLSAEDDDWFWNRKIAEVDYEGLNNVKKSNLTAVSSSYEDKEFTEELYAEMLDRLYALDYFEDIVPYVKHARNPEKIRIVFQVVERPVVGKIEFNGNSQLRNGDLRDKVNVKVSDVYIESSVLYDDRNLRDYYISKGFTDATVSHTTSVTDKGDIVVTFNIDEGSKTVISKIGFSGNTIVSERTLKGKLKLKEAGLFKDGAFQQSTLETDKQIISAYYQERGYIDFSIDDVVITSTLNEDKSRNELSIIYYLSEGSQYIYNGTSFVGNEVFPTERLASYITLKQGAVYDNTKFQQAMMNITSLYYENGYMSLGFNPVPSKDADKHEISYNIFISENPRSHIENISVKGNTKTKDYVILREIPIESGDVFSRDRIMSGLRNLYNTQYFSVVNPEYNQGSEPNLVDMVFTVEEQSTNTVQFGLTFSGAQAQTSGDFVMPFSVFGKLENSNLFGEGRSLSTGVTLSTTEQSLDVTYGQSWIKNLPIQFSSSLAVSHNTDQALRIGNDADGTINTKDYYMPVDGFTVNLGNSIGRRWVPNFAILTLAGGINNAITSNRYDESIYIPVDPTYAQYANRWGLSNSIWTSFSMDGRDVNYDPTKGWFFSEKLSWYGFIPMVESEFYLRSETKLEGYVKLLDIPVSDIWSFKLVFAAQTGLYGVYPTSNYFSDTHKLYIDGMFNGRGWQTLYAPQYRGKAMWTNNIELRIPLAPNVIGVAGFFDAAVVKNDTIELFTQTKLDDFYFSYGPSIRFLLPQFPLHMLFTWKFKTVDGEIKLLDKKPQFVLSFNLVNK